MNYELRTFPFSSKRKKGSISPNTSITQISIRESLLLSKIGGKQVTSLLAIYLFFITFYNSGGREEKMRRGGRELRYSPPLRINPLTATSLYADIKFHRCIYTATGVYIYAQVEKSLYNRLFTAAICGLSGC